MAGSSLRDGLYAAPVRFLKFSGSTPLWKSASGMTRGDSPFWVSAWRASLVGSSGLSSATSGTTPMSERTRRVRMSVPVRMLASLVRSASASGRRVFEWAGRDVSRRTIPEGGRIVKENQWPGKWLGGTGGCLVRITLPRLWQQLLRARNGGCRFHARKKKDSCDMWLRWDQPVRQTPCR